MAAKRNEKYTQAYETYLTGLSLEQIAKNLSVTRQCVFKAFKQRGFKLRALLPNVGYEPLADNGKPSFDRYFRAFQIYDDKKFTLRNNGYFALTTGKRTLMHRYVWTKEKGPIPDGYDIHHKDEDKSNNAIGNLECLSKPEHTRKYSPHNNQYTKGRIKCK